MARAAPRHARAARILALLLAACALRAPAAPVSAVDDQGHRVELARPATRIVAVSPAITELLFYAGAGGRVIAGTEYSDYPPEAAALPRVARAGAIDIEKLAVLHPDLVIVWGSGFSPATRAALERLGVPVYVHEVARLEDLATSVERFGRLAGTDAAAAAAAARLRERLRSLQAGHLGREPLRAFYQVWQSPVMTLGGHHYVSEALRLCGARNVFEDLPQLVATVGDEAVLARNPQIIITTEPDGRDHGSLARWARYPQIEAVASGHFATLDANLIDRPGPRLLDGVQALCDAVDAAVRDGPRPHAAAH